MSTEYFDDGSSTMTVDTGDDIFKNTYVLNRDAINAMDNNYKAHVYQRDGQNYTLQAYDKDTEGVFDQNNNIQYTTLVINNSDSEGNYSITLSNKNNNAHMTIYLDTSGFFAEALRTAYTMNSAVEIFIYTYRITEEIDNIVFMHHHKPGQPIQPVGNIVWIKYQVKEYKMYGGKPKSRSAKSKSTKPSSAKPAPKPKASPKSKKPSSAKPAPKPKASPKSKKPSSAKPSSKPKSKK